MNLDEALDLAAEINSGGLDHWASDHAQAVQFLVDAIERVRERLQEDVWSDSDSHGRLQKYLDVLEGRTS